jgi:3-oxoacyl-[acyl-carrier protein] reductase
MLNKKICFITGGSRGIGRSIVNSFLKNNAIVVFTYLENEKSANDLYEKVEKKYKSRLIFYQMNVSDRTSVRKTLSTFKKKFDRIDVLVNNAGVNHPEDFDKISDSNWDLIMNTNLKGPFIVTQEALGLLKKSNNSSVINIGSVSGQYGGPRTAHYAASKAGLISLSQVIARYGSEFNIRCNTLSAGLIQSEMADEGLKSKAVQQASENIILKRFGNKSEVSDVALFLASDKSSYITAQTINVNGGLYF